MGRDGCQLGESRLQVEDTALWESQVTDSCKQYGGFYLGSVGGAAAVLAEDCIKKVEATSRHSKPGSHVYIKLLEVP